MNAPVGIRTLESPAKCTAVVNQSLHGISLPMSCAVDVRQVFVHHFDHGGMKLSNALDEPCEEEGPFGYAHDLSLRRLPIHLKPYSASKLHELILLH